VPRKLDTFLKLAKGGSKKPPHIAEVVEHVLSAWGGPEKFAKSFHDEYRNAKPGSMTRARMLESMMRLMQVLSAASGSLADDTGLLSDAELEDAARSIMESFDAQEETPSDRSSAGAGPAASSA
jgi:hypothetical protein